LIDEEVLPEALAREVALVLDGHRRSRL